MSWIKREAEVHKCNLPVHYAGDKVATGDIWECPECGKQHEVTVHTDQREPGAWFTWKLYFNPTD